MPSAEHEFVSASFVRAAEELARSDVFAYVEADRGRFDFACLLRQHIDRAVVGQTLRSHAAGIEKDLNWLLLEPGESVPVYLYADTAAHVSRIAEVVSNAKHRLVDRVSLLRLYPFPVFDADDDRERAAVAAHIREQVLDDLLMNVVFGRLAASDVLIFLNGLGIRGLQIAALEVIARDGFTNFPALGRAIGINPSTVRPRVINLLAAGMLKTRVGASVYYLTQRGRVFLRIAALVSGGAVVGPELEFILRRLGLLAAGDFLDELPELDPSRPFSGPPLRRLVDEVNASRDAFGIPISGGPYADDPTGRFIPGDPDWVER